MAEANAGPTVSDPVQTVSGGQCRTLNARREESQPWRIFPETPEVLATSAGQQAIVTPQLIRIDIQCAWKHIDRLCLCKDATLFGVELGHIGRQADSAELFMLVSRERARLA